MSTKRKTSDETRELIIAAAENLIVDGGGEPVTVVEIMQEAGVSRTAFYRQFESVHDVFATLLSRVTAGLLEDSGAWMAEADAIGSPEVVRPNILGFARSFGRRRELLTALHDAGGCDDGLRRLWHAILIQPNIDSAAAAIARDQAANAVAQDIDPESTALALTLLGEGGSVELLGRRGMSPEEYTDIMAPIWISVLFGSRPDTSSTR